MSKVLKLGNGEIPLMVPSWALASPLGARWGESRASVIFGGLIQGLLLR